LLSKGQDIYDDPFNETRSGSAEGAEERWHREVVAIAVAARRYRWLDAVPFQDWLNGRLGTALARMLEEFVAARLRSRTPPAAVVLSLQAKRGGRGDNGAGQLSSPGNEDAAVGP